MAVHRVTLSEILEETKLLASRHTTFLGCVLAAVAAAYTAIDWLSVQMDDQGGAGLLLYLSVIVVAVFVQYPVIERLLVDRQLQSVEPRLRRFSALFGAWFLSSLAISVAVVFLILPGVYLAGRWLTASARVVEGKQGARQALRTSWEDSEPSQLAFSLAAMISFAPILILLALSFAGAEEFLSGGSLPVLGLIQATTALSSVAGWTLGAAAYRVAIPTQDLDKVFS